MKHQIPAAATVALALLAAACGSSTSDSTTADTSVTEQPLTTEQPTATEQPVASEPVDAEPATRSVTLVAYDSFPEGDTSLNDALDSFTAESGITVELLIAGDTGTMLSKAALTAGNPEGDVMWGIDNTFLSRAIDEGVFEPYVSPRGGDLLTELTALVPNGEVVPVDFGDVCVNYDIAYFADHELAVPTSLSDLADPVYKDLLVVEDPSMSSPGLAFLFATIDEFGVDGWQDYWTSLQDNGVEIVSGWTDAYYTSFTWAGGGDRPLVVSYGSSPPAEVLFADPSRDDSPTGVIESTCFRQVEFAGVLAGTDAPEEARALIDFLVSDTFQTELALNLFVYPANSGTVLPQEFVDFAVVPASPHTLDADLIDNNRTTWIDEWFNLLFG